MNPPSVCIWRKSAKSRRLGTKGKAQNLVETGLIMPSCTASFSARKSAKITWFGVAGGATLAEDDAERLASELLAETDAERLERYLFLFQVRPFPLDHTPLLALAQNESRKIAAAARAALARIEDASIHDLALELMETDDQPWELIELLVQNFHEGDEKTIERVLEEPWGAKKTEWIGLKLRQIVAENLTVALAPALLLFYERGYCTMCRHGTIELLDELGRLPSSVIEEGRYDADNSIQELVQQIMSSNGAA